MLSNERNRASIALAVVLFSLLAGVAFAAPPCDNATALDPNTLDPNTLDPNTIHHFADGTEGLRLQVPATGILTMELSRPARIDVVPDPCGTVSAKSVSARSVSAWEVAADVLVAERSARHVVFAARTAGVLFLRVTTVAPHSEGRHFRVATDFTEARLVVEDFDLDGMPVRQTSFFAKGLFTKAEPEEVEPDADGMVADGGHLLAAFLTLEISLAAKAEPEEVEPDADGLTVQSSSGN